MEETTFETPIKKRALIPVTLIMITLLAYYGATLFGLLDTATPGKYEIIAGWIAFPAVVLCLAGLAHQLRMYLSPPIRVSKNGLDLPWYWRSGRRNVKLDTIRAIRPESYAQGTRYLVLKVPNRARIYVPLGVVEDPKGLVEAVRSQITAS